VKLPCGFLLQLFCGALLYRPNGNRLHNRAWQSGVNGQANSKESTVGLGPGIQLGNRGLWFGVNGNMETDVRNRPSGIKVAFRISKALAAEH
jgi:hypothetical protein